MSVFRSEDKIIEFVVTDTETGTAVDLDSADGIIILLYQFADKPLDKYSVIATAGYKDIRVTNAAAGTMEISFEGVVSVLAIDKPLYADIKMRFPNVNFPLGYQDIIAGKVEIDLMADSPLKFTQVPT